jgi:hypothetical protein
MCQGVFSPLGYFINAWSWYSRMFLTPSNCLAISENLEFKTKNYVLGYIFHILVTCVNMLE